MQPSSLSRSYITLASASIPGNLGVVAVTRQMRRLFGPFGGAVRQNVSAAADIGVNSSDDDYAEGSLTVTPRKIKKKGRGSDSEKKSGGSERGRSDPSWY